MNRAEQARYPEALQNDLIQLRDAALVFSERGREQECATMANDMDDMLDDFTQRMEAKRERAAQRAYLQAATPVAQINGVIRAEDVVGVPVRNLHDQELGAIENVALDPASGEIAYVALVTGGFMGLSEKLVAIPWRRLSLTNDGEVYVLDLSIKALERMKGFDGEHWPAGTADEAKLDTKPAPHRAVSP